jgi:hypothetical protein
MFRSILIQIVTLIGIVCFAGLFLLIFADSVDLKCVRQTNGSLTCEIRKEVFGQFPISSNTVTNVKDVQMEQDCSGDSGCSYRADLVTSRGDMVPVNDVYTDEGPVSQQAAQISDGIHSGQPSFDYHQDTPWWVVFLIGGLGLLGVIIVGFWLAATLFNGLSQRNK